MNSIIFEKKHLEGLLNATGRTILLVQVEGGFHLQIAVPRLKDPYILQTQRNHPRLFRSLDRAAALLQKHGVKEFTVEMQQPPKQVTSEDSEIPF